VTTPRPKPNLIRKLLYGGEQLDGLLFLARRLGTQRAAIEEILGTARLVGWATSDQAVEPPTITVDLAKSFEAQSQDRRESIVQLLWQLARHCEVVVVGSPIDLRWLIHSHDLDRSAFSERWTEGVTQQRLMSESIGLSTSSIESAEAPRSSGTSTTGLMRP